MSGSNLVGNQTRSVELVYGIYRQLQLLYPSLSVSQFCVQYLNTDRNYLFIYRRQSRAVSVAVLKQLERRLGQLLIYLGHLQQRCQSSLGSSVRASVVLQLISQVQAYSPRL